MKLLHLDDVGGDILAASRVMWGPDGRAVALTHQSLRQIVQMYGDEGRKSMRYMPVSEATVPPGSADTTGRVSSVATETFDLAIVPLRRGHAQRWAAQFLTAADVTRFLESNPDYRLTELDDKTGG